MYTKPYLVGERTLDFLVLVNGSKYSLYADLKYALLLKVQALELLTLVNHVEFCLTSNVPADGAIDIEQAMSPSDTVFYINSFIEQVAKK